MKGGEEIRLREAQANGKGGKGREVSEAKGGEWEAKGGDGR